MNKLTLNTTIILAIASLAACKSQDKAESRTNSLDNLAAAEGYTLNSCSGNNPVLAKDGTISGDAVYQKEIRTSLSALPTQLQSAFFDDLNGSIVMTKDIAKACADDQGSHSESMGLTSCYQAPGGNAIVIFIKQEADHAKTIQNIRHSTVRSFGYVMTEVMLKIDHSNSGTKNIENSALETVKADIRKAFIANVQGNKKYDLQKAKAQSADTVFAETFDSYYCSNASRSVLKREFAKEGSNVYKMYQEIDQQILGMLSDTTTVAAQGDSLSLWGRWGWGNGPIRQGFRNWANWRAQGNGLFNFRRAARGGGFVVNRARWFGR
jgi:hypothetical protein